MDDEGSIRSRYQWLVYLVLLLIALVLIIISSAVLKPDSRIGLTLFAIGTAIMSSTLFSVIHAALGTDIATQLGRRMEFNKRVHDTGLEAIHLRPAESIFDQFEAARSIDMMGATLRPTYQRYQERIEKAVKNHGCKVRIIVGDPENAVWENATISGGFGPGIDHRGDIRWVITQLTALVDDLRGLNPPLRAGSIEVKRYPSMPTCSIIIVNDQHARLTPYLPYATTAQVPKYDIVRERGTLFQITARQAFDRAWQNSPTVIKQDFGPQ